MNYKYILFDLDGTIIDSHKGIIESAKFALNKMGVPETQIVNLESLIGPPLKVAFKEFFSLSDEFADKATEYYREYYRDKGIFDYTMYDGIVPLLEMLKSKGYIIALATSKPVVFATRILDRLNISQYFDLKVGANLDKSLSDKAEIISLVCNSLSIHDPSQAIMIGDRKYDILGANANGIDSIGVLYGFGNLEEFQDAGASYVVNTVEELGQLLYSFNDEER